MSETTGIASSDSSPQPAFRRELKPEEIRRFFDDCSAMCVARLLKPQLTSVEMEAAVTELRTVQNLLTQFELAQQDLEAQARYIEQRRKEMDAEIAAEYVRKTEERGRRSARPIA